jgi:hypothetical protein
MASALVALLLASASISFQFSIETRDSDRGAEGKGCRGGVSSVCLFNTIPKFCSEASARCKQLLAYVMLNTIQKLAE